MITIIITIITINIIIIVVVVDDDTYYWVYLSSDHTFQFYYKVRQVLLQNATGIVYNRSATIITQSATEQAILANHF